MLNSEYSLMMTQGFLIGGLEWYFVWEYEGLLSLSKDKNNPIGKQLHMSEFPEPQQESAAACENRDIGPFRKGPNLTPTILLFAYLQNPGLEAIIF